MPTNNQQIKLRDGRLLGYAEFGHPDGKPILYFHGAHGSRLSGKVLAPVAMARAKPKVVIAKGRRQAVFLIVIFLSCQPLARRSKAAVKKRFGLRARMTTR